MKTSRAQTLTFAAMAAEYLERMGARMRQRREELELSRDEVARRMAGKTNGNAIYRWERGEHRPQDDTLEELAKALEVTVAYFFVDEPEPGTGDLMGALSPGGASQLDQIEQKLDHLLEILAAQGLSAGFEQAPDPTTGQPASSGATRPRRSAKRRAS